MRIRLWRLETLAPERSGFICSSSLLAAGRYQELLDLLEIAPFVCWADRRWGVQALAAMGKTSEALSCAEASRGLNDYPDTIARTCEEILLSSGWADEAYERYALAANRSGSYLTTLSGDRSEVPAQGPGADFARFSGAHAG